MLAHRHHSNASDILRPVPRSSALGRLFRLLPSAHFMALAPLDAWVRLLLTAGGWRRVRARALPRLGLALCTSALATIATLPERLLLAPFVARRGSGAGQLPLVFVLGYYRSGTTHLHYLLTCDPSARTPRWYQVIAPTGFIVSWTVLRWLLVPFLSSTRPQDDVAIGPEWPAEDDFAVNNLSAACTMPGRMILPGLWAYYRRYQTLEGLTPAERARFRRSLAGFVRKVSWLARFRAGGSRATHLVLKSPAHTARVRELIDLFGADRVRFIHLSRDAGAVVRSNVSMHRRFDPYLLEDHPGDAVIRERIIEEYDLTERAFIEQSQGLPPSMVARVRYQDLIADPMAEVQRCYKQLGLAFTPAFAQEMGTYLASVADYRTAAQQCGDSVRKHGPPARAAVEQDSQAASLAWMRTAFGHVRPTREAAALPGGRNPGGASTDGLHPALAAVSAASFCTALWLAAAAVFADRLDWLAWPVGIVMGIATIRSAALRYGHGSWRLGVIATMLTALVVFAVAFPATALTSDYRDQTPPLWADVWASTRRGVSATNNMVWYALGMVTAFRYASRRHIRPPGG